MTTIEEEVAKDRSYYQRKYPHFMSNLKGGGLDHFELVIRNPHEIGEAKEDSLSFLDEWGSESGREFLEFDEEKLDRFGILVTRLDVYFSPPFEDHEVRKKELNGIV